REPGLPPREAGRVPVADRPDRPRKYKGRHRKPSRLSRVRERMPEIRRPVLATAAGGVLAASAVAGTVVVATGDDDDTTPAASPAPAMDYDRAAPKVSRDGERPEAGAQEKPEQSLAELKAQ